MKRNTTLLRAWCIPLLLLALLFALPNSADAQMTPRQKQLIEQYSDHVTPDGKIRCITPEVEKLRYGHRYQSFVERFERYISQEKRKIDRTNNRAVVYTIPVIFHIVHNGQGVGSGSNVTAAVVNNQLEQLNNDFRKIAGTSGNGGGVDTEIQFCAALVDENGNTLAEPGINRFTGASTGAGNEPYSSNDFDNTIKPASQWDPDRYFNIWSGNLSGGLLGYAQFPEAATLAGIGTGNGAANTDGVVVLFSSMGSTDVPFGAAPYDKGRTLTHEVGHWLGLRHIWGDGGCGVDDFCADTPTADGSNFGCPNSTSCGSVDQVENYMDYTDDDCMERFTQDQTDRMRIVMGETGLGSPRREVLLSSTVCNAANSFDIAATNSPVTVCQPSNATFNFDIAFVGGFAGSIALSATGLPGGLSANFSTNPVTAAGSYTVTISGTAGVSPGSYNFNIDGDAGGGITDSEPVTLVIDAAVSSAPSLISPADGAGGVSLPVALSWSSVTGASSYDVEVATDAGFSTIVSSGNVAGTATNVAGLAANTLHYWRVRGVSSCNTGVWSSGFSFITSSVSPCLQYAEGPYIDFEPPACYPNCLTPTTVDFEVWANESYQIRDLVPGAEYTFEFCTNYDPVNNWEANITVADFDDANQTPVADIITVSGCSVTFTAPASGDVVVIIFDVCGNPELQVDNGEPTFSCTGNGSTLPTLCPGADCDGVFEDFEGGEPSDWTFNVTGTPNVDWQFDANPIAPTFAGETSNPGSGNWAYFDDDAAGQNAGNNVATATSGTYDLSTLQNIELSFDYAYTDLTDETVSLSITDGSSTFFWNGSSWITTSTIWLTGVDIASGAFVQLIPSSLDPASISVTLTYDDDGAWAWGFGFDNFGLCGDPITTSCPNDLTLDTDPIASDTYSVVDFIESAGKVRSPDVVVFEAGQIITLKPGFVAENGADFTARIQTCTPLWDEEVIEERTEIVTETVDVYPNPFNNQTTISLQLAERQLVTIDLYDLTGRRIQSVVPNQEMASGQHQFILDAQGMEAGMYILMIRTGDRVQTQKLSLIK